MNFTRIVCIAAILSVHALFGIPSAAAQTAPDEIPASTNAAQADADALLRSNLLVQEQLHSALRAIEQARTDANDFARRNEELFSERLSALEKNLTQQRANDLQSLRNSNRLIFASAALLGGIGVLALILTGYFQMRALNRVAKISELISAALPAGTERLLGDTGFNSPARLGPAEQSSARFTAAIDQLEKKIHDLESKTNSPSALPPNGVEKSELNKNSANGSEISNRTGVLLSEGQALLDRGEAENAITYFDQAIELEPNNTDALLKKAAALETMRKLPEAVEIYDRVIAADPSVTVAYLYKGGVLNRLQRSAEAMKCYEQALRTHPNQAA